MVNMTRISIRAIHLSKESTTDSLRKQSKKFRKEAEDDNEDRVFLREQMVDTTRIGIPGRANYLSEDFQQTTCQTFSKLVVRRLSATSPLAVCAKHPQSYHSCSKCSSCKL